MDTAAGKIALRNHIHLEASHTHRQTVANHVAEHSVTAIA